MQCGRGHTGTTAIYGTCGGHKVLHRWQHLDKVGHGGCTRLFDIRLGQRRDRQRAFLGNLFDRRTSNFDPFDFLSWRCLRMGGVSGHQRHGNAGCNDTGFVCKYRCAVLVVHVAALLSVFLMCEFSPCRATSSSGKLANHLRENAVDDKTLSIFKHRLIPDMAES